MLKMKKGNTALKRKIDIKMGKSPISASIPKSLGESPRYMNSYSIVKDFQRQCMTRS